MCKARSSKGAIFGQGGNLGNTTIRLVLEAKWKWDYFDKLYLVAINGLALHCYKLRVCLTGAGLNFCRYH